ncbi:MAG: hypothetical protein ACKPKO_11965, partial [Candidatus Fonsibacter sp.]
RPSSPYVYEQTIAVVPLSVPATVDEACKLAKDEEEVSTVTWSLTISPTPNHISNFDFASTVYAILEEEAAEVIGMDVAEKPIKDDEDSDDDVEVYQ